MNLQEKKTRKFDFLRTQFSESAFTELALFDRNAKSLINVIKLEMMLHEKLEKKEFETGLPDEFLTETKQFLYKDVLAKIMMLIEGLLALSDAISDPAKGYSNIAEVMTSYRDSPLTFIERFKAKNVDLWRLAGLPALDKLPISGQEKETLKGAFDETEKVFEQFLSTIIKFYECNSIPYNKFKHGLSLIPGLQLKNQQQQNIALVMIALDRRSRAPGCTTIETKERLVPPQVEWFNILCFVPSPQKESYELIINSLLSAISYMTSNHMFYAANCGEDYFPVEKNPQEKYVPKLLLPRDSRYLEDDKKRQLEPIIKKIVENMNVPTMTFNFNLDLPEDKIARMLESFRDHASALIWSSEAEPGSAKVDLTY